MNSVLPDINKKLKILPQPSPISDHHLKDRSKQIETTMAKSSDCPNCTGGPFKAFCPFSLFLFTGTAVSYVKYLQSKSKSPKEPFRVVFVLGGPGAGKVRRIIMI
jgi:hypothetical protein